jgi:prepilin-type N-terminal cleavage/methylation domain-containing protein/prepilin-type processing-associated H-X9-DG protein
MIEGRGRRPPHARPPLFTDRALNEACFGLSNGICSKDMVGVMKPLIAKKRRVAFTLVELLVVIAIIGVLVALLLPAVQAAREAARRAQCLDHMKNVAIGCTNYETAKQKMPYGRKFNYWDTYTWVQAILPFIEQQAVYNLYYTCPDEKPIPTGTPAVPGPVSPIGNDTQGRLRQARHAQIPVYYCPSDGAPFANEMGTQTYGFWRGSYRGCVGGGDMYGTQVDGLDGALLPLNSLLGAFGVRPPVIPPGSTTVPMVPANRLKEVSDGTSNTILISEGISPQVAHWGGPIGGIIYGNMGGSLFSAAYTPNTGERDRPIGPCPLREQQDDTYTAPCELLGGHPGNAAPGGAGAHTAARSKHPGGVNAAMVDGSVRFVNDSIDLKTWRRLGTRDRDDIPEGGG